MIVATQNNNERKKKALKVEWNIGKRCNYDCSYCDIGTHDNFSPHMSLEVWKNTIDKILDSTNKKVRIALTGGEPFINPNFLDMIKYGKEAGVSEFSVVTNGTSPLSKYVKSFDYIDGFNISYHFEFADNEKILEKIVLFDRLLRLNRAENGKPESKDLIIHIMFLPGHIEQAKEAVKVLSKNEIKYVIRRIRPQKHPDKLEWLKPYTSGMTGVSGRRMSIEVGEKTIPYYNEEELKWMKNA